MGTHRSPRALVALGELGFQQSPGAAGTVVLGTPVAGGRCREHGAGTRTRVLGARWHPGTQSYLCGPWVLQGAPLQASGTEQRSQRAQGRLLLPSVMTVSLTGI